MLTKTVVSLAIEKRDPNMCHVTITNPIFSIISNVESWFTKNLLYTKTKKRYNKHNTLLYKIYEVSLSDEQFEQLFDYVKTLCPAYAIDNSTDSDVSVVQGPYDQWFAVSKQWQEDVVLAVP